MIGFFFIEFDDYTEFSLENIRNLYVNFSKDLIQEVRIQKGLKDLIQEPTSYRSQFVFARRNCK